MNKKVTVSQRNKRIFQVYIRRDDGTEEQYWIKAPSDEPARKRAIEMSDAKQQADTLIPIDFCETELLGTLDGVA